MDLNELTLGQAKEIAAFVSGAAQTAPKSNDPMIEGGNRAVIVRSRDAGVQFGYLDKFSERGTVYLKNARQMWSWTAAEGGTLLDCATTASRAASSQPYRLL